MLIYFDVYKKFLKTMRYNWVILFELTRCKHGSLDIAQAKLIMFRLLLIDNR